MCYVVVSGAMCYAVVSVTMCYVVVSGAMCYVVVSGAMCYVVACEEMTKQQMPLRKSRKSSLTFSRLASRHSRGPSEKTCHVRATFKSTK